MSGAVHTAIKPRLNQPSGRESMSVFPTIDPVCSRSAAAQGIATVVDARPRDLGGFTVGRVLPAEARRHVGPFVFFDHMGPADLAPGHGLGASSPPPCRRSMLCRSLVCGAIHAANIAAHPEARLNTIVETDRAAAERLAGQ